MRLFLDSSTLIAAAGSETGASRLVVLEARESGWNLVSSEHCLEETRRNVPKLGLEAIRMFEELIVPKVQFLPTAYSSTWPLVYPVAKDRPVVISALALECEALLTLDRADFQGLLGHSVYGVTICTPGDWLRSRRE